MKNKKYLTWDSPNYNEWKNIVIKQLKRTKSHFQAFYLGAENMAKLVDSGIFYPGINLGDMPDIIWLDNGDCDIGYEIDYKNNKIYCDAVFIQDYMSYSESNIKNYVFTIEQFMPHELSRNNLYQLMARDLSINAQVIKLTDGIWEIGRKNIPFQGRAKFIFVEQGVEKNDIVACLALHGFKTNCLLYHGNPPALIRMAEKHVVSSPVLVVDDHFVTEAFEDLMASRPDSIPETSVDLDSTPQKVVIMGDEFPMPLHQGKPLIGLKYLSVLFDRARESIPVWELFLEGHPGDVANETGDQSDDNEVADSGMVVTGTWRQDKQPQLQPSWDDVDMDAQSRREIGRELKAKRKQLEALTNKGIKSGRRVEALRQDIADLEKHLNKGSGSGGRRRAIKHTDTEKARDSVRKALKVVIRHVKSRNSDKGRELRESIDFGYEMMFKPPPEWGI